MRVIARRTLREHWELPGRGDSEQPLKAWANEIERTEWKSFAHLRERFPSADLVGDRIVFNIAGNKYRLITMIHFERGRAYVRFIGTHAEYSRLKNVGSI